MNRAGLNRVNTLVGFEPPMNLHLFHPPEKASRFLGRHNPISSLDLELATMLLKGSKKKEKKRDNPLNKTMSFLPLITLRAPLMLEPNRYYLKRADSDL